MDGSPEYTDDNVDGFLGQRANSTIYKCDGHYFHKEKQLANGNWVYRCAFQESKSCRARAISEKLGVQLRIHPDKRFQKHEEAPNAKYPLYAELRQKLILRCLNQRLESLTRMYDNFLEFEWVLDSRARRGSSCVAPCGPSLAVKLGPVNNNGFSITVWLMMMWRACFLFPLLIMQWNIDEGNCSPKCQVLLWRQGTSLWMKTMLFWVSTILYSLNGEDTFESLKPMVFFWLFF